MFTTPRLIAIALCAALNFAVGSIVYLTKLPIYLDSIGTILCAMLIYPDRIAAFVCAFVAAMISTVITSLFSVPDAETRELMKHLYTALKGDKSKLDALHDAQTTTIRARREKRGAAHPFFWAGFVLVGAPD